jgi:hypothetical protein
MNPERVRESLLVCSSLQNTSPFLQSRKREVSNAQLQYDEYAPVTRDKKLRAHVPVIPVDNEQEEAEKGSHLVNRTSHYIP